MKPVRCSQEEHRRYCARLLLQAMGDCTGFLWMVYDTEREIYIDQWERQLKADYWGVCLDEARKMNGAFIRLDWEGFDLI